MSGLKIYKTDIGKAASPSKSRNIRYEDIYTVLQIGIRDNDNFKNFQKRFSPG